MNKKQSSKYDRFAIIHHFNSPNSATTLDGKEVRRQDKIWYADYDDQGYPYNGRFIACAPDDQHFVYADPMGKIIPGRWTLMCTCGSPAVIVGSNVYAFFGSPSTEGTKKGEMIVCKYFLDNGGKHQYVKR